MILGVPDKIADVDRIERIVNAAATFAEAVGVDAGEAMFCADHEDRFIFGWEGGPTPRGLLHVPSRHDRKKDALLASLTNAVGRRLRLIR